MLNKNNMQPNQNPESDKSGGELIKDYIDDLQSPTRQPDTTNGETNEGGVYNEENVIDEDTDAPEAGTPGHPGIDNGTG